MIVRERVCVDTLPPLWAKRCEKSQWVYFNSITNSSKPERPHVLAGGYVRHLRSPFLFAVGLVQMLETQPCMQRRKCHRKTNARGMGGTNA